MVLKAPILSGRSSGVEHNLAKVGVVSSNLIARSKFPYNMSLSDIRDVTSVFHY